MGYIRHHAILVTGWNPEHLRAAHNLAKELFGPGQVSAMAPARLNGYQSFAVFPDGSKEGWSESDRGDTARSAFKAWLRVQARSASVGLDWAEVQYGDDDRDTRVLASSDHDGEIA